MPETQSMDEFITTVGKTFIWHELYVPNAEAGRKFYMDALGWGEQDMPMGEMGTYRMFTVNGQAVGGVMSTEDPAMASQNIPPHWSTYIAVDDVDARLAKCQELGATVVVPPMDIPTVGRMTLIADPQGAHVWLFTPNPQQG